GMHSSAIYYLLENEIAPMFYAHRDNPGGDDWMKRVKQSLRYLSQQFDARRMVPEYNNELYQPAHSAFADLRRNNFEHAREKALWSARVNQSWDRVRIVESTPAPASSVMSGKSILVRAAVDLGGLNPKDVRVEAVLGRVGSSGSLEDTEIMVLPATEETSPVAIFSKEITPRHTGRLGYALRVSPNHYEDPLTRPCPDLLRWG